jgi:transcriptional regulator with XRE-family HTH domain
MIGEKLRQIREQKGLKLKQVAQKANLSLSYMSDIEHNRKKLKKPQTLEAIGNALELTEKELEEIKIDAKISEIGMKNPSFTMMFKEIAIGKMTLDEKRKILDVYDLIKHQRQKLNDQY